MGYPEEKPLQATAKYVEVQAEDPHNAGDLSVELATYHEGINPIVHSLALLGLKDRDIAEAIGVSIRCFNLWKVEYPELGLILNDGRNMADANVAKALYRRATGYDYVEERAYMDRNTGRMDKIKLNKHIPADVSAGTKWLAARRPEQWRETKEVDVKIAPKKKLTDLFDDSVEAEIVEGEFTEDDS